MVAKETRERLPLFAHPLDTVGSLVVVAFRSAAETTEDQRQAQKVGSRARVVVGWHSGESGEEATCPQFLGGLGNVGPELDSGAHEFFEFGGPGCSGRSWAVGQGLWKVDEHRGQQVEGFVLVETRREHTGQMCSALFASQASGTWPVSCPEECDSARHLRPWFVVLVLGSLMRRAACDEAYLWQEVEKGRGQRKAGSRDPGDGRGRIRMARGCVSLCGGVVKYPLVQNRC